MSKPDKNRDQHQNIINGGELEYEPNGGLGYEFFGFMKLHENKISQIVADTGEEDTYGSLLKRCISTSIKLRKEGITQNDIISSCTYNHANSYVPFLATIFIGAKVASLDPTLSVADTTHLLKQVKPTIIFLVPEAIEVIEKSLENSETHSKLVVFGETDQYEAFGEYLKASDKEIEDFKPVKTNPEETAVIYFSSGTTGLPKGICMSSYALLAQGVNMIKNGYINGPSLYFSTLYWISTSIFLSGAIISGTVRVFSKAFNPKLVWTYLDRYKIGFLFLAPIQAIEMYKAGRPDNLDTSNLVALLSGGGNFSENHMKLLGSLLPGTFISQTYGLTEVAGAMTVFRMNDVKHTSLLHEKPRSCGRPMIGIQYKIVDPETENIVGANEKGELRVKTRFSMIDYYNADSSDFYDSDGWLKTGDMLYYDEDHCFYVVDRFKELLKYRNWQIPPAVLENVLVTHPAVKKGVVVGIPNVEDGDHAMAIVVLENNVEDVSPEDIVEYVNSRVSEVQKIRAGVRFVNSLPITPSGKVKKMEIRRRVLAGEL